MGQAHGFISDIDKTRSRLVGGILFYFMSIFCTVHSTQFTTIKLAEWMNKLLFVVIGCDVVHQRSLCLLLELSPF